LFLHPGPMAAGTAQPVPRGIAVDKHDVGREEPETDLKVLLRSRNTA
jgi:hypothetical protein